MFPTVLSAATSSVSDTLSSAQAGCAQLIHALRVLNRASRGDSAHWRMLLTQAQSIQDVLSGQATPVPLDAASTFVAALRRRREEAGLSQRALAERVGLSESLIRLIEQGKKRPTPRTIRMLLGVRELGLAVEHLVPAAVPARHKEPLNWWVAPNFDAVDMLEEFKQRLTLPGGRIEQTYAYLDHQSALDYCRLANDARYVATYRNPMPLEQVAQTILEQLGPVPLDVVALGPGDGHQETRLSQALVGFQPEPDLRFYLLDISQPLLSRAHRHAKDCLDSIRGVTVVCMQGSFHYLPLFEQIFYSPSRRRRLFSMLGLTLSNLDDEPRFFREALRSAAPGDLLLIDFTMAFGSPERPVEIKAKDPALRSPMAPALAHWFGGPFHRYAGAQSVDCRYELDVACPIPGSYSLDVMVKVVTPSGSGEFQFSRHRRYDAAKLSNTMKTLGWDAISHLPFGTSGNAALMLLRKRG